MNIAHAEQSQTYTIAERSTFGPSTKKIAMLVVGLAIIVGGFFAFHASSTITPGTLVKNSSLSAVYYYGSDGNRYAFPNEKIYFSWYNDFNSVQTISDSALAAMPLRGNVTYRPGVRMVKLITNPKVFAVERGGVLRWVTTESIATALYGSGWATHVDDLSDAFYPSYTIGDPIESASDYNANEAKDSARTIGEDKNIDEVANSDDGALPLDDGNRSSTTSAVGYVYSCQSSFGGGGSMVNGPWIDLANNVWYPSEKVTVDGSVAWPSASVDFSVSGDSRLITGNGLPVGIRTGTYPISSSDDAYAYDRNPNPIRSQSVSYTLPRNPSVASSPSCLNMGLIAIATDGSAIFNALDAQGRDAPAHEIQDSCGGHPERSGQYHYHALAECFDDDAGAHSPLFGYALDGFGIFGNYGASGEELTNDDLDVCHGHTHTILWDGEQVSMYHYHTTDEYPYTLGCFKGTPVSP